MAAPVASPTPVLATTPGGLTVSWASGSYADVHHFDIYRGTLSNEFWTYAYLTTVNVGGVLYPRIRKSISPVGAFSLYDQSVESGIAYTYFVRAIGTDLVSYTDSATATATCTLEDTWIVAYALAVGSSAQAREFRFPQPGLGEQPDLEVSELLFAGRVWPVLDTGIHQASEFSVNIDVPYGEQGLGYGYDGDLRYWANTATVVVYRDKRGRRTYGRIKGLQFSDSQYGVMASFTVQALDVDGSV